eukprot:493223_1
MLQLQMSTATSKEEEKDNNDREKQKKPYIDQCSKFIEPVNSDHMDCAHHDIKNCNVMKRIIHLLYQNHLHQNASMYEYISNKKYNTWQLMEDWHQTKREHLKHENQFKWMTNNLVDCDVTIDKCEYVKRHQRISGNYISVDHEEVMIQDILDSIHTFIFHPMTERQGAILLRNIAQDDSDNEDKEDKEDKEG